MDKSGLSPTRRLWQQWQLTRAQYNMIRSQRPLNLVPPLLGAVTALALIAGGIIAFEHADTGTRVEDTQNTECTRLWVEGSTLPLCPIMFLVHIRQYPLP
ncbi:hypothetical protein [Nocardia sp. NPDC052316]|uniref:hypothetical protein n=1 Tax=Nocardia sp. NPDC052316 TaxID=3364329 RepID=UPI0037CBFE8C